MHDHIAPGIWRVGGSAWGLADLRSLSDPSDANVYLITAGGARLLIDAGTTGGQPAIESNLRECGVSPKTLSALLLTHSHFDHTQAARAWQQKYALPVYLNAVGANYLRRVDLRLVGHQIAGPEYRFDPFTVDHPLADGQRVTIANCAITAHHLPGHTPDSTLLVIEDGARRIGLCGDITFAPRPGSHGEIGWLSQLWISNLILYESSLTRLLKIPLDLLLPGHGHPLQNPAAIRAAVDLSLATVRRLRASPDTSHFGIPC